MSQEQAAAAVIVAWNASKYRVFSAPYFPAFRLNTEKYEVSLRIQWEFGKIGTRKNSVFGHISHSDYCTKGKETKRKVGMKP